MTVEADPAGTNKDIIPDEKSFDRRKHWLDYVTLGLELFGLIVLLRLCRFTIKIYHAIKRRQICSKTLGEVQEANYADSATVGRNYERYLDVQEPALPTIRLRTKKSLSYLS